MYSKTFYYENDQKCTTILFLVLKTGYYQANFLSILSLVSFADEIYALKRYCEESLGITSFAGLKHLVVFFCITSLLCTAIR